MAFSIDPAHRVSRPRRARKSAAEVLDDLEGSAPAVAPGLPVPVGPARTLSPKAPVASAAQIEAQMIGERRGLRAGASVIDEAKVTYNRTEWSGAKDRRSSKGRVARTKI